MTKEGRRKAPLFSFPALRGVRSGCPRSGFSGDEWRSQTQQISRIDCQSSKPRAPVQVRGGDATGGADEADFLTALDGVTDSDFGEAHVEVAGHQAIAVIDVDDVAGEEEAVDQGDHAAVRGVDRVARRAAVVNAEVAARDAAVKDATGAETARDSRLAGPRECLGPKLWRVLRVVTDGAGELVFSLDARFRLRVEATSELGVDAKPARARRAPAGLSDRWRLMRILEGESQAVERARPVFDDDLCDYGIRGFDRNGAERLEAVRVEWPKVKRLAGHRSGDANYGIARPVARQAIDRQPCKGPGRRLTRLDLKSRPLLRRSSSRNRHCKQGRERPSQSLVHGTKIHQRPVSPATAYPSVGTKYRWM